MENEEFNIFKERYTSWSTEDLIKAATVDKNDYYPEAIELMFKELNVRNISQQEIDSFKTEIEKKKPGESKKLEGIGGFLLFFLLALCFNLIIGFLGGLRGLLLDDGLFVIYITSLMICVYGAIIFFLLIKKSKSAIPNTRIWLILNIIVSFFLLIMAFKGEFHSSDGTVLLGLFSSIAWLIYFFQSERVTNTYCKHEDFQSIEEK